jgi:hypothetical protein
MPERPMTFTERENVTDDTTCHPGGTPYGSPATIDDDGPNTPPEPDSPDGTHIVGWLTGLEPATPWTTTRCSTN